MMDVKFNGFSIVCSFCSLLKNISNMNIIGLNDEYKELHA